MLETTVIPGVILISLIIYALLGGADFGGGIWDLLATGPRARPQQEAIADALAPVWETNHVWLILVVTVLFTAYPVAYGAIMTALHIPVTIVLLGIILRGVAFIFRKYDVQYEQVFYRWSLTFGISSALTPFFLGISLGALASGQIQVVEGNITSGFLAGWTSWFALSCGLFAQGLFAFLAAVYMTVETHDQPQLQNDFRLRALLSELLLAPIAAAVFFLARADAPVFFDALTNWWAPYLLVFTSVCALGALGGLWARRFKLARYAAGGQVSLILLGWGLAQYPYLILPDLTFESAAAPDPTLQMLAWALGIGALVLLPALWYLFRVFKSHPVGP